jgi:hypothetical protein
MSIISIYCLNVQNHLKNVQNIYINVQYPIENVQNSKKNVQNKKTTSSRPFIFTHIPLKSHQL